MHAVDRLRVIATTFAAVASALVHVLRGRDSSTRVMLAPGDTAPDFSMPASDGRMYRLSDFKGRQAVVLAWFPKAFTGGCMAECESIGATRDRLQRFNVAYFAASVDRPETNRQFAAAMGLAFPILSDPDRSTARAYGVLGRSGYALRWTFYIGRDGRILDIDKNVDARTHGPGIVNRLSDLRVFEDS